MLSVSGHNNVILKWVQSNECGCKLGRLYSNMTKSGKVRDHKFEKNKSQGSQTENSPEPLRIATGLFQFLCLFCIWLSCIIVKLSSKNYLVEAPIKCE